MWHKITYLMLIMGGLKAEKDNKNTNRYKCSQSRLKSLLTHPAEILARESMLNWTLRTVSVPTNQDSNLHKLSFKAFTLTNLGRINISNSSLMISSSSSLLFNMLKGKAQHLLVHLFSKRKTHMPKWMLKNHQMSWASIPHLWTNNLHLRIDQFQLNMKNPRSNIVTTWVPF